MDTITHLVSEFFRAGADTTNTTLRWTLMFMVSHPEIQKKVHNEIDEVIGRSRPATIKDRDSLPYTQAAVWEAMRMVAPAPLALPHSAVKDGKLGDYDIPAHVYILPNLHSVHMDPTCWENPQKYDPARFIDPDGKLGVRDAFMPFGTGHRSVAGEQLARMELFLFFTFLMQRFRFELPEGAAPLCWDGTLGITYTPEPFQICCLPR
ncbi:cytochrome P450 2U1-like [Ptychodera flava]|uniref:cytochrome P450 2U1-like n=1 Tax=Ptychodera flava TaxID=63121 RepID=UPI00396A4EB8